MAPDARGRGDRRRAGEEAPPPPRARQESSPSASYAPEIPLSFNLVHKLTDQWNGIFYADDSQIVDLVVRTRFALKGRRGVEIIVAPMLVDAPDGPRVPVQGELATR